MVIKPCFAKKCNIVEDDGARVRFHPVCPKCGEVMRNCIESGHCSLIFLLNYMTGNNLCSVADRNII